MIPAQYPQHSTAQATTRPPRQCMRHGVWMAVCDDCRAARTDLVSAARKRTADR